MFSRNKFNPEKDLKDLTDKVAFVTGGNRGMGYETVKGLARKGATVYLGSRSEEAGKAAVARLEKESVGKGKVIYTWCDFGTTEKAEKSGKELLSQINRLDICVLNGALLADFRIKHLDDIVITNHFGNLKLLQTILPLLEETSDKYGEARLVTCSSNAHKLGHAADPKICFESPDDFRQDWTSEGKFKAPFSYYAFSKFCQTMTHVALHKRNKHPNLIFSAVDPGWVNTFSHEYLILRLLKPIINLWFDTPEVGCYNLLFAAASPKMTEEKEKYDGKYLLPVGKPEPWGANVTVEKSEKMLDLSLQFLEKENMFPLLPRME
ncbi:hypothetical protein AGABI2DRAFT_194415 [Agaricus bisporus var. bisporus H97]|uniref:hypothetical protein n=1 Tax=Agaricus bisporus var. bisporus (strain H97 / ATCC MYA-4626 / FGSC 10389) TaxID=936046 RepID=UPI00029F6645|nr:hypothetical protein AGABI2DRAFT_194415 [Agaricus bisporus var. bisporus H97]EKV44335.1 hypothetical protein AGABI2DRAFT_194415 [Agaricus bisporus var. bisporus H97]